MEQKKHIDDEKTKTSSKDKGKSELKKSEKGGLNKFFNLSLNIQVGGFYLFVMIMFMIFTATNKFYYNEFIFKVLTPQLEYKSRINQLNNINQVQEEMRYLMFLSLYTKDLANHDIATVKKDNYTTKDMSFKTDLNAENLRQKYDYSDLYKDTSSPSTYKDLNFTILDLGIRNEFPAEGQGFTIDPNNIIPIIWEFTPIFTQHYERMGIMLESTYFLGYKINNCFKSSDDQVKFNAFFKFPLKKKEMTQLLDSNLKAFDFILEPIGSCYDFLFENEAIREKSKKTNWYKTYESNFIKFNKTLNYQSFKLLKLDQNNIKTVVSMAVNSIKLSFGKDQDYIFSFVHQTDIIKDFLPYETENLNDEDQSSNTFSIYEGEYLDGQEFVPFYVSDNIYLSTYNIDDHYRVIKTVPQFIQDMFRYGVHQKSIYEPTRVYKDDEGNVINLKPDSALFSQYFIDDFNDESYNRNFLLSYPFSYDFTFFKYVNFMADYLNSKFYYNESWCRIRRLDLYNDYLKSFNPGNDIRLDCLYDICKIIDCTTSPFLNKYHINPEKQIDYFPNCYCLPLFCYDNDVFSENITYHKEFKPLVPYIKNITDLPRKCSINFLRKDNNTKFYSTIVNSFFDDISNKKASSLFSLSMQKFTIGDQILELQEETLSPIKKIMFFSYIFLLFIIALAFTTVMMKNVKKTSFRINKLHNFYANVINNSLNGLIEENNKLSLEALQNMEEKMDELEQQQSDKKVALLSIAIPSNIPIDNPDKDFKESKKPAEIYDELTEFKNLITSNLDIFKVDFTIDQNIYNQNKIIDSLKKEFMRDCYTKVMLHSKVKKDQSFEESAISEDSKGNNNLSFISEGSLSNNMNFYILYELMSTEMIDFDKYTQNFYFTEKKSGIFNFYDQIDKGLLNDEIHLNETTDVDKLEKSIEYYINEVHKKWMKKYENSLLQFSEEEEVEDESINDANMKSHH